VEPAPWYVHELNKRHAIVPVKNRIEIISEEYDAMGNYLGVTFPRPEALDLWYRDQRVKKGRRMATILEMWLEHPRRRKYQELVFEPGQPDQPNVYNLFKGYAVEPQQGNCEPYLEHIYEIWCKGNQRHYAYTIAWLADIVQNPRQKPGVALVLIGEEGTGKSLPCDEFGQIFGSHFVTLERGLFSHFNAHLIQALVVLGEEAFWAGDKKEIGPLKHLITGRTMTIEQKGKDKFSVSNYIRLMICSNDRWVVPASIEARRFFVLEVSNRRRRNYGYFGELSKFMKEGGREALLYFLLHHNYTHINLRDVPQTEALQENKEESMSPVEKFILEALKRGRWSSSHHEWLNIVACQEIHEMYLTHAIKIGQNRRSSETELGKALTKLLPSHKKRQMSLDGGRINAWEFPDLDTCRKEFDEVTNWPDHNWPCPEIGPAREISKDEERLLLTHGQ
jgi:phage/plasmid-associated DNA primase